MHELSWESQGNALVALVWRTCCSQATWLMRCAGVRLPRCCCRRRSSRRSLVRSCGVNVRWMPRVPRLLPTVLRLLEDPADDDIAPQPLAPLQHLHLEPIRNFSTLVRIFCNPLHIFCNLNNASMHPSALQALACVAVAANSPASATAGASAAAPAQPRGQLLPLQLKLKLCICKCKCSHAEIDSN